MTLFTLLIVMALERVALKSKAFHITSLAKRYFVKALDVLPTRLRDGASTSNSSITLMLLLSAIPAGLIWLCIYYLPSILVFFLYIVVLWVCLGCPLTRQTYKRYLQAANREDFEACSLYSEQFGNKGGDLSNVGKQLVLVNYRQYASVIIFFVLLGLPGVVFYSLCKEWYFYQADKNNIEVASISDESVASNENYDDLADETLEQAIAMSAQEQIMYILDWVPVRITTFGFLLVGHFSNGLPVWLDTLFNTKLGAYDVLARVAKACEDIPPCDNRQLQEALTMVKLVKRNIIFLLMLISFMTLAGLIG